MDKTQLIVIASLFVGLITGFVALVAYRKIQDDRIKGDANKEAEKIIAKARSQSQKIERDATARATDFETRARRNAENDVKKEKQRLQSIENNFKQKEGRLDGDYRKKEETLNGRLRQLDERNEKLKIQENRLSDLEKQSNTQIQELRGKLEHVAGLSTDQA